MSETTFQTVEHLLDRLTLEEQIQVIEQLALRLRRTVRASRPQNLYGIWRGRFPAEFDVDTALAEIRHSWENEWKPNPSN